MRTCSIPLLLTPVLLFAACAPETGVLIAVSGSDVDQLEFQVGVQQGEDFVLDQQVSGQLEDVRGRNLRANPFELMLRQPEKGALAPSLRVLAIGWQITPEGRERYSFAVTEPPQGFIQDEVVRRNLVLGRINNDSFRLQPLEGGCYRASRRQSDGSWTRWTWSHRLDRDCDDALAGEDCDDFDPSIYPGATERCDAVDQNCDGQPAPDSVPCYGPGGEPTRCRTGIRRCKEVGDGSFQLDPCLVGKEDPVVPEAYCAAYAECQGDDDQLACADSRVKVHRASCLVEAKENSVCAGASLSLEAVLETKACRWVIVSSEGLTFGLSVGGGSAAPKADACEPLLMISGSSAAAGGEAVLEFFDLSSEQSVVGVVGVTTQEVESCSAEPIKCQLEW